MNLRHRFPDNYGVKDPSEVKGSRKKVNIGGDINSENDVRAATLISTDVLDMPSQRGLALTIFTIIQSYKLYDLVLLKSGLPVSGLLLTGSRFNFILKYCIIDSLFLYFLPAFRIPKLSFSSAMVFCQICLLTSITVILSHERSFPIVSTLIAMWSRLSTRELSLTGGSVDQRKVLDVASHFKGAHTIKILPENTAMLNPFHDSYCLPMDHITAGSLEIPIRLNSTSEIGFLQLEYRDLQTNKVELWNYTKSDLTELPLTHELFERLPSKLQHANGKPQLRYLSVPVKNTGMYQINKIKDVKGISLRLYKSHVLVPHCPSAVVSGLGSSDRCVGDFDRVTIDVQGIPPLELQYTKLIGDEVSTFTDSSLQPEFLESPLLFSRKPYSAKDLADLKWAISQSVSVDLEKVLRSEGHVTYRIDKVVDGLGNEVNFAILPGTLLKKYGLEYGFDVHDLPRARLDFKFDSKAATKKSLVLDFDNVMDWKSALPYRVTILFEGENGQTKSFSHNISEPHTELAAQEPGTYTLVSVESRFCAGIVVDKSSVMIHKPIAPTLQVMSSPILDQCVGQVGLNFDLKFTGVPPFYYRAKIYKLEKGDRKLYDTKKFTSQGTRNQFSYNPTSEGNYEIVFDEISNSIFTHAIPLRPAQDYTFRTSMRVKPDASIKSNPNSKLCLGDRSTITVNFKGEPPFALEYDILETSTNKRTSFTEENIKDLEYKLETPNFNVGGDYILSLVSVKDSSACAVSLSSSDARIEVRREIPKAEFSIPEGSSELLVKEGSSADVSIRLSGVAPFVVGYQHYNFAGKLQGTFEAKFLSSHRASLSLQKQGIYKLLSVRDRSCIGEVGETNEQALSFLKKPSFKVVEHNRISNTTEFAFYKQAVCKFFEETVDLTLIGNPPFTVLYELASPTGKVVTKQLHVATKYASIVLPNEKAGLHTLTVTGVSDSNYGEEDLKKIGHKTKKVVVRQQVNDLPHVQFFKKGHTYRTCPSDAGQPSGHEPIGIEVSHGRGPFTLSFSVYHESTSKTDYFKLEGVTERNFNYERLFEGLKLGSHDFAIEKVIDSNGCVNEYGTRDNHVLISINDVPKISLLEPSMEYCVGDYVSYQLSGIAPFHIKYDFNGISLKSKEYSSQFIRLASEPGIISINALQDSSSKCIVNFTRPEMEKERNDLSLLVHPIPSVTVSRGDYIVEDIHEGDQAEVIFSFEGTPPFSLAFVRTELVEDKRGRRRPQVVETHRVEEIYGYEYRVVTNLQGTYEAIEISDAFCQAKNEAYFNGRI
ncbi:LAMI_0G00100g1_1 [Lachancea mirantina]|uniref:LAMI_0G00100g1_1 n=1 Tax=Lachancea mirantina TaxID=1230905 RepID=A0A1G4K6Y9_9SACH|nr:LAMI_0G00100g1_1 [Lachancea mirantina]